MTNKQFRQSIVSTCYNVMSKKQFNYKDIQINNGLPTVSIGEYFFAQGQDADELLNEAQMTSGVTGLNVKTCLVWYLESAGVFQY